MSVEVVNPRFPLGTKGRGHYRDAAPGPGISARRLALLFHAATRFAILGDLLRHEDDQAGTRFGHREEGKLRH